MIGGLERNNMISSTHLLGVNRAGYYPPAEKVGGDVGQAMIIGVSDGKFCFCAVCLVILCNTHSTQQVSRWNLPEEE